ncbi:MAG: aldo/keto reductase [Gemmatimonadaceae bacterium]|nr:aldo/keto reductase [Gemmatimonadaceae bacterium]
MHTRKIGSLNVSIVGLGCNNFGPRLDAKRTKEVVDAAIDAGINFFDTATLYGSGKSEEYLGKALKTLRSDVIIATKFGYANEAPGTGAGAAYIRKAIEASLKRLGTDYIDLYQQHRPDSNVPIAETLGALNQLVVEGKVREIGCSYFDVPMLHDAAQASKSRGLAKYVSVQNEFSLFHQQPRTDGVLEECERTGMAFLPYFPLANGLVTGKYRNGQPLPKGTRLSDVPTEQLDVVERLVAFAELRGATLLELAFSWLLAHRPVASVIAGATKPEQVRANAAAPTMVLNAGDISEISRIAHRER